MPTKVEGAKMDCKQCDTELTCRTKDYGGQYKPILQWQNEDGTAHYKTTDGKNFTCVTSEGEYKPEEKPTDSAQKKLGETPKVNDYIPNAPTLEEKIDSLNTKVERIFAMIEEQYHDYIDRKGSQE